jgi:hypothetical protein
VTGGKTVAACHYVEHNARESDYLPVDKTVSSREISNLRDGMPFREKHVTSDWAAVGFTNTSGNLLTGTGQMWTALTAPVGRSLTKRNQIAARQQVTGYRNEQGGKLAGRRAGVFGICEISELYSF